MSENLVGVPRYPYIGPMPRVRFFYGGLMKRQAVQSEMESSLKREPSKDLLNLSVGKFESRTCNIHWHIASRQGWLELVCTHFDEIRRVGFPVHGS